MATATEILLRRREGEQRLALLAEQIDSALNQYIVYPLFFRLCWRIEMQRAMHATRYQLTHEGS